MRQKHLLTENITRINVTKEMKKKLNDIILY